MTDEAHVRDFLKDHLELLESDLELVDVEVHVRDPEGSDGFIDILAVDKRDYLVLIEVKRERSAAREGLQELAKYARLFAEQSGLLISRLRCIVVSADWNELHAAFTVLNRHHHEIRSFSCSGSRPVQTYNRLKITSDCSFALIWKASAPAIRAAAVA